MPESGGAFSGTLYRISADRPATAVRSAVACSNGLAWAPDGSCFYFVDSPTRRIDRYEWDATRGAISNPIALASFSSDEGLPDGMCIDRDGNLWVAFWGGSCVRCIDGRTGAVRSRIELPVTQVTSCAFGGPDLSTLFITTARIGLDAPRLHGQPLAGSVFTCQPGAVGLPVDRYSGPLLE